MGRVVGIDLGTTNSLVAFVKDGAPVVIPDAAGERLLPSVVSVGGDGRIHVGQTAVARLLTDAGRTVYSVKRFMGKGIDDVRDEARMLPFAVSGEAGGVVRIGLGDKQFTPPEISAFILRELKQRAEQFFADQGEVDFEIDRAVITVPAYFNNEPTAASLAYGLDKRRMGTIAVYDFGGGTFDVSILRVEDGVFQVLSTNGDTHLGGDDIDLVLTEAILADLRSGNPRYALPAFHGSSEEIQGIRQAVIAAKCALSDREQTTLLGRTITRDEFEAAIAPIVERTLEPCRQALTDAGLAAADIDEVVLVGGSTRIPLVRRRVGELFGRIPHTDLNPDEVVALGAAVQADILVTGNREMLLLDVTPLSLGIETMGGVMTKIILRNSTIPATGSEMFTTAVDNQTAVDVHVLQGERELVADNRSLARFKLRGIPPMPAGMARVQVQFQIDANGILSVTASELRTNVEQSIEVKPSYGLTDDEVERMLLESFEHAEADFEARLLVEARNEAEVVIAATEKTLRGPEFPEIAATLSPAELKKIDQALAGLKHVVASNDRESIKLWTQALNDATQHLAEVQMNRSVQAALSGKNIEDIR
jgi:molecular chaperone DnaK